MFVKLVCVCVCVCVGVHIFTTKLSFFKKQMSTNRKINMLLY